MTTRPTIFTPRARASLRVAAAVLLVLAGTLLATACETPVWRYALYRWAVEPYTLVLIDAPDGAAAEAPVDPLLNLEVVEARRAADGTLLDAPDYLQETLAALPSEPRAAAVLIGPHGAVVRHVALDEWRNAPADLTASPARDEIRKQLTEGRSGMLLVLTTAADRDASDAAVAEAEAVIARGIAGKIAPNKNLPANVTVASTEPPPNVGLVVVDRDDPREQWLVQMLLAVEEELHEYDAPMVFGIYGRARAMEPYIGAGITPENMDECVGYITGACSCEVKAQNPGVDLLMAADWETISTTVAAQFNGDDALKPAPTPEEDLAVALAGPTDESVEPSAAEPSPPVVAPPAAEPPAEIKSPAAPSSDAPAVAPASFAPRLVQRLFLLGIGVFVATAIAGFALWRLRG